jgi:hypothetical protein
MQLTAMESRKGFGKGRGYGGFQVGRGRKNAKMCAYCGKIGHTIEICYYRNMDINQTLVLRSEIH